MPSPSARRLLPIVLAYLPVPIIGAILSAAWDVGASPEGGSTANLPNDFAAAEAAGSPLALTAVLAVVHIALSRSLLYNALPALFGRRASTRATA